MHPPWYAYIAFACVRAPATLVRVLGSRAAHIAGRAQRQNRKETRRGAQGTLGELELGMGSQYEVRRQISLSAGCSGRTLAPAPALPIPFSCVMSSLTLDWREY